jgi:glutaminase
MILAIGIYITVIAVLAMVANIVSLAQGKNVSTTLVALPLNALMLTSGIYLIALP